MIYDSLQVDRFINRLPDLEEGYCYLLMLVLRSRYFKERYGMKISDTVLEREIVPWYHGDYWRSVYAKKLMKLSHLGNSKLIYSVRKEGQDIFVSSDVMGILAVINPADMRKALAGLLSEVVNNVLLGKDIVSAVKVNKRWFANLHKHTKRVFHTIDIDDKNLLDVVLSELDKYVEPHMIIETARGYHVIIHLPDLSDKALAYKYFVKFVNDWMRRAREYYRDEHGKPLIEYLKQGLEPVPGTLYAGHKIKLVR